MSVKTAYMEAVNTTQYPFTPELLDALPEELAELFRGLEEKLLYEICSRLKVRENLNEVTVQDIRALRAHGIDLDEIKKAIARTSRMSMDKLDRLFDDVVARNAEYYGELATLADITLPEQLVSAADISDIYRQTKQTMRNITRSMGFVVKVRNKPVLLPPARAYQHVLDSAEMEIQSGAISYNQAIGNAVRELADSGLVTTMRVDKKTGAAYPVVVYDSGHVSKIDVAVRRAVMTGINQLCDKNTERMMELCDTPYCELTAHAGARDKPGKNPWSSHKDWQGKVYYAGEPGEPDPRGEYPNLHDATGFGEVDGLEGANCRHHRYAFIPGITERTYTDEQLAHIDDGLGCDFEGRHYTSYEATQKQREIERTMRMLKLRKMAYEAAGMEDEATATTIRMRRLSKKYTEFSKAAHLPEQRERMKVTYSEKPVEISAESGIIETESQPLSRYLNSSETLYEYAQKVKPIEGYEDVFIHGDSTGFSVKNANGVEVETYTPREFAGILREDPNYHGGAIRLCACGTGANGATAAEALARQLEVDVLAPSDTLWIDMDGNLIIGETPMTNTGEWILFKGRDKQ